MNTKGIRIKKKQNKPTQPENPPEKTISNQQSGIPQTNVAEHTYQRPIQFVSYPQNKTNETRMDVKASIGIPSNRIDDYNIGESLTYKSISQSETFGPQKIHISQISCSPYQSDFFQGLQPIFLPPVGKESTTGMNSCQFEQAIDYSTQVPQLKNHRSYEKRQLVGRASSVCSICNEKIYTSTLTAVQVCKHSLHSECLLPYLQFKVKQGQISIGCPFSQCSSTLSQGFLRKVLPQSDLMSYYKFSAYSFLQRMILADECKSCPQPNCKDILKFLYLPQETHKHIFSCRKNNKKMCAKCLGDYHPQFTCSEYKMLGNEQENQKRLKSTVTNKGWKQCPNCKVFVEKNQGCNHITCRCKHNWCYVCEGPWPKCFCATRS